MGRKRKRGKWRLKGVEVTFNAIVAKVKLLFGKDRGVPARVSPRKRRQVRIIVDQEIARTEITKAATPGPSRNVVADTFVQIADRERKKAIRRGEYETAVVASIVQYYAEQARDQKGDPRQGEFRRWS